MKKTNVIIVAFAMLSIVMMGILSGCSASEPEENKGGNELYATVIIECQSLWDNRDALSETLVAVIPEEGNVLSVEVPYYEGDTALDITKRACTENSIILSATGGYVSGIAGIYERDAGGMSGWKFSVNDEFGGQSAGKIEINEGDTIFWGYTLDGGNAY